MKRYINEYRNGTTVRTVAEFNSDNFRTWMEFELACKSKIVELTAQHNAQYHESTKCCRDWKAPLSNTRPSSDSQTTKPPTPQTTNPLNFQTTKPLNHQTTNLSLSLGDFATRESLTASCAKSLALIIEMMTEIERTDLIRDMSAPAIQVLYLLRVIDIN